MKLIDTSSWIDALRRDGDPQIRARVVALMASGEAAWCDLVRLELWNGLRGAAGGRYCVRSKFDGYGVQSDPRSVLRYPRAQVCGLQSRARG